MKMSPTVKGEKEKSKVLVSACLLGYCCRYNGEILPKREIPEHPDAIIAVCPEELGGLPTPRSPSFFEDEHTGTDMLRGKGRIISDEGEDRSAAFLEGARKTLEIAHRHGAKKAYLKERSPSCGCQIVYVRDTRVPGMGVTAALLSRAGIKIIPVE